jgi:alpha-galactosidase
MKFPHLNPDAMYQVKAVHPAGRPRYMLVETPDWLNGIELSGSVLANIGISVPILAPANAFLIEISRI